MSIYRLVVDQDRCIACHACEASCKAAHDSAPGISLGTLLVDGPRFEDAAEEATPIIVKHARPEAPAPLAADGEPRVVLHTRYRACVQCPQPRCVEVCPTSALVPALEKDNPEKPHFLPNQHLLPDVIRYQTVGANSWITSDSFTDEKRVDGGVV